MMISLYNVALISWSPFQNWRLKWWSGSEVKCWKAWWVKRYDLEMMTKADTQETWLPVSVLSWSAPVPIGILHLWGFIPLSQNGALELKGWDSFQGWNFMRNAVNCLHRELLLHGEFCIKQKWLRVKINLENSILKTNLTSIIFI